MLAMLFPFSAGPFAILPKLLLCLTLRLFKLYLLSHPHMSPTPFQQTL